jgi:glutathione synthase/RimK-type ligase-like ATP-grasp enzyme
MAIHAAKALHCDIAGVDLAYADGRYYIFEVNSQPGWRGLQSVFPEVDIAMEIAKYVVEKAKK